MVVCALLFLLSLLLLLLLLLLALITGLSQSTAVASTHCCCTSAASGAPQGTAAVVRPLLGVPAPAPAVNAGCSPTPAAVLAGGTTAAAMSWQQQTRCMHTRQCTSSKNECLNFHAALRESDAGATAASRGCLNNNAISTSLQVNRRLCHCRMQQQWCRVS
jgi:hypothetical protein